MFIKQLSIFVENNTGKLHSIVDALGTNGISISALSLAETTDFGVLRVIVSDVEKAREVLKEMGVISKVTDVIAVYLYHRAGGLAAVLKPITAAGVNVEYMYAFLGRKEGKALMVLKPDNTEKAVEALQNSGIQIATADEI